MEHKWREKFSYGYATGYKCEVCGKSRHVEWSPGWPPTSRYFSKDGDDLDLALYVVPECTPTPVDGLFGGR